MSAATSPIDVARLTSARRAFVLRLLGLALLLLAEWGPVSVFVSTRRGGQSLARALVAFIFCFFILAAVKYRRDMPRLAVTSASRFGWLSLFGHAISFGLFVGISVAPLAGDLWTGALWYALGFCSILLAAFAFLPLRFWRSIARSSRRILFTAALAAFAAWLFVHPLWSAWDDAPFRPLIDVTFNYARLLLKLVRPEVISDRSHLVLGTPRFAVAVGGACAGFEGAGLMLAFSVAWIWYLRRDLVFPRVLLLIPASVSLMWLLNGVRIAVLILIGDAGAPEIAMGGFHSQAGWISFNLVAAAVVLAAGRVSWWNKRPPATSPFSSREEVVRENPTAAYLMPFLAILGAAMVSHAAAGTMEWLYPLRFFAAGAALWFFRDRYRALDWKFGWVAPLAGVAAFLVWIGLDAAQGRLTVSTMPALLASSAMLPRFTWILFRAASAIITVPIAEELAFRGFLIHRLISADFEALDSRRFTWPAVAGASLAFGLMHGERWIAGIVAGAVFAGVYLRKGRIGDAVVAHATANLLIAAAVLGFGYWGLW